MHEKSSGVAFFKHARVWTLAFSARDKKTVAYSLHSESDAREGGRDRPAAVGSIIFIHSRGVITKANATLPASTLWSSALLVHALRLDNKLRFACITSHRWADRLRDVIYAYREETAATFLRASRQKTRRSAANAQIVHCWPICFGSCWFFGFLVTLPAVLRSCRAKCCVSAVRAQRNDVCHIFQRAFYGRSARASNRLTHKR